MALVTCPDCGADVSEQAPVCVRCGRPMAAIVVEATGKDWKVVQLIGWLIVLTSPFLAAATGNGTALFIAFFTGAFVVLVGKIGAWWKHG